MKNFKKFALVFVLILSFGLIFTTGCNLFGGNDDGDGDDGKNTLTIDEIDDMVSQNLFSHFSGIDLDFSLQGSYSNSGTVLFDGESGLSCSTSTYGSSQTYLADGMSYDLIDKSKMEYQYPYTMTQTCELYLSKTGLNNYLFKVSVCEELISSNSVTETTNGYKVKLVLNTTKAAELNVVSSDYLAGIAGGNFDADFTKYEITYEFNSQDKLVSIYVEAITTDGVIICSIKDYTGTVSAPEGFDPDEYTLFQP